MLFIELGRLPSFLYGQVAPLVLYLVLDAFCAMLFAFVTSGAVVALSLVSS